MKRKPASKSLFELAPGESASLNNMDDYNRWAAEAYQPERMLEQNLLLILKQAEAAEKDQRLERGAHYAREVRARVNLVREYCAKGKAHDAALWAILLTEKWMQLRTDAAFAKPVREERQKMKGFREQNKRPKQDVIAAALKSSKTRLEAADKLSVSARTLRRWLEKD